MFLFFIIYVQLYCAVVCCKKIEDAFANDIVAQLQLHNDGPPFLFLPKYYSLSVQDGL